MFGESAGVKTAARASRPSRSGVSDGKRQQTHVGQPHGSLKLRSTPSESASSANVENSMLDTESLFSTAHIGVNWPHRISLNQDFAVIGATGVLSVSKRR